MLVLVLPALLLVIIGFIITYCYLIFRPERLASVEEKARTQHRGRPAHPRRARPRP